MPHSSRDATPRYMPLRSHMHAVGTECPVKNCLGVLRLMVTCADVLVCSDCEKEFHP